MIANYLSKKKKKKLSTIIKRYSYQSKKKNFLNVRRQAQRGKKKVVQARIGECSVVTTTNGAKIMNYVMTFEKDLHMRLKTHASERPKLNCLTLNES